MVFTIDRICISIHTYKKILTITPNHSVVYRQRYQWRRCFCKMGSVL